MVELKLSGCCKDCNHIQLDLQKTTVFWNTDYRNVYSLRCIHEPVCGALEKELTDGKADEDI